MNKKIFLLFLLLATFQYSHTQTLSPTVTPTNGGYYNAGGNSLSWTMGETYNTTLSGGNNMLTQGQQQPYIAPTSVISGTQSICAGAASGNITVALTGTPPWSITYSDGITPVTVSGIMASPYTFTVSPASTSTYSISAVNDANSSAQSGGNTGSAVVTVNTIPPSPAAILGNSAICGNTSSSFTVAAVAGATSYTWTLPTGWSGTSTIDTINTIVSTTGGIVTVTANNVCGISGVQTFTISVNNIPAQPTSISGVTQLCNNSPSIYYVTHDNTASSYTWLLPTSWTGSSTTDSITATAAATSGVISVTATNGCGTSNPSTLNVVGNAIPIVTVSAFGTVCHNLTTFTLSGGSPAGGTYGGTAVNSNLFDPSVAGLGNHFITYTVTNGACIRSDSATITVVNCTGINSISVNNNIDIYPNPTSNEFTISIGNAQTSLGNNQLIMEMVDVLGKQVIQSTLLDLSKDNKINIEQLNTGIYFVRLIDKDNNIVYSQKIIKQ